MKKKLIIIKIGTSSLTSGPGDIDRDKIKDIVDQVSAIKDAGHDAIIVSSGAIAAGFRALGYNTRPSSVKARQASAAVGQGLLMEEYTRYFLERGYVCGQILLTRDDFTDKRRYKNIYLSVETLISRGAIPVINENDTIAVEELHLGDNDTLSAQVAAMFHADELILLTDKPGLFTSNPDKDKSAKRLTVIDRITPEIEEYAGGAGNPNGTGGMITKVRAAALATSAGVSVFICSSKDPGSVRRYALGTDEVEGTLFRPNGRLKTRLQWMAFYSPCKGNIFIDEGAKRAITEKDKSLLCAGIAAVEGDFSAGDVVRILSSGEHEVIGRGIAELSRDEIESRINSGEKSGMAVSRDNLVISILS